MTDDPVSNILALLKERDMSQSALAKLLNWPRPTLNQKLTGKRQISMADIRAIAAALNVQALELYGGEPIVEGETVLHIRLSKGDAKRLKEVAADQLRTPENLAEFWIVERLRERTGQ